jgi:hypothetical protein
MHGSYVVRLQLILVLASAASGTAFQPSPSVRGRTQHQRVMCDGIHARREEGSLLPGRRVLPRRGAAVLLPALGFMAGAAVRGAAAEDGAGRQGLDKAGLKKDYDRYSASYEVSADPCCSIMPQPRPLFEGVVPSPLARMSRPETASLNHWDVPSSQERVPDHHPTQPSFQPHIPAAPPTGCCSLQRFGIAGRGGQTLDKRTT